MVEEGQTGAGLRVEVEQRVFPPYDELHGTPHAMLQRRLVVDTPQGRATLEQTDYGHPGKMNPWEQRGIASALQPKLSQLRAVAEAVEGLL